MVGDVGLRCAVHGWIGSHITYHQSPLTPVKGKRPDAKGHTGRFDKAAGDGLLSHDLPVAVPSALQGLTAVFGMGTGVAPAR